MTPNIPPKVIFVDGPTGVGKGYFIRNFVATYTEVYPDQGIKIIRAADVVMNDRTVSEDRKYTTYHTDEERTQLLYEGHIRLLRNIKQSFDTKHPPGIVIVDRSFLSFIHYNLSNANFSDILRSNYVDNYFRAITKYLKNIPSLIVRLDLSSGQTVTTIIDRIQSRNDLKAIDETWLNILLHRYRDHHHDYDRLYTHAHVTTSGRSTEVFRKFL